MKSRRARLIFTTTLLATSLLLTGCFGRFSHSVHVSDDPSFRLGVYELEAQQVGQAVPYFEQARNHVELRSSNFAERAQADIDIARAFSQRGYCKESVPHYRRTIESWRRAQRFGEIDGFEFDLRDLFIEYIIVNEACGSTLEAEKGYRLLRHFYPDANGLALREQFASFRIDTAKRNAGLASHRTSSARGRLKSPEEVTPDGIAWEGSYENGLRHGVWEGSRGGRVVEEHTYRHGELLNVLRF